jgi:hypothetical protein
MLPHPNHDTRPPFSSRHLIVGHVDGSARTNRVGFILLFGATALNFLGVRA